MRRASISRKRREAMRYLMRLNAEIGIRKNRQYPGLLSSAARQARPTRSSTAIIRKDRVFTTFMAILRPTSRNISI